MVAGGGGAVVLVVVSGWVGVGDSARVVLLLGAGGYWSPAAPGPAS